MNKIILALSVGFALCFSGLARADYPEKPVNFIVPFPPGDLEDVLTRLIAEDFQEEYGVAAAVVNKPGGGGGPFSTPYTGGEGGSGLVLIAYPVS